MPSLCARTAACRNSTAQRCRARRTHDGRLCVRRTWQRASAATPRQLSPWSHNQHRQRRRGHGRHRQLQRRWRRPSVCGGEGCREMLATMMSSNTVGGAGDGDDEGGGNGDGGGCEGGIDGGDACWRRWRRRQRHWRRMLASAVVAETDNDFVSVSCGLSPPARLPRSDPHASTHVCLVRCPEALGGRPRRHHKPRA